FSNRYVTRFQRGALVLTDLVRWNQSSDLLLANIIWVSRCQPSIVFWSILTHDLIQGHGTRPPNVIDHVRCPQHHPNHRRDVQSLDHQPLPQTNDPTLEKF